jgi:hypothetical protein
VTRLGYVPLYFIFLVSGFLVNRLYLCYISYSLLFYSYSHSHSTIRLLYLLISLLLDDELDFVFLVPELPESLHI